MKSFKLHLGARWALVPALALALVAAASPVATAAPVPEPRMTTQSVGNPPSPKHRDVRNLSKDEKFYVALDQRLIRYAVVWKQTPRRAWADYRKLDRYDQGHTTARRKFAAGFQFNGGHLTNISRAEQTRINRYKPKGDIYRKLPHNVFGVPYCQGKNNISRYKNRFDWKWNRDSCKSAMIMAVMLSVSLLGGVLAAEVPGFRQVGTELLVICGLGSIYIGYLIATSKLMAIWLRMYYPLVYAGRQ